MDESVDKETWVSQNLNVSCWFDSEKNSLTAQSCGNLLQQFLQHQLHQFSYTNTPILLQQSCGPVMAADVEIHCCKQTVTVQMS